MTMRGNLQARSSLSEGQCNQRLMVSVMLITSAVALCLWGRIDPWGRSIDVLRVGVRETIFWGRNGNRKCFFSCQLLEEVTEQVTR